MAPPDFISWRNFFPAAIKSGSGLGTGTRLGGRGCNHTRPIPFCVSVLVPSVSMMASFLVQCFRQLLSTFRSVISKNQISAKWPHCKALQPSAPSQNTTLCPPVVQQSLMGNATPIAPRLSSQFYWFGGIRNYSSMGLTGRTVWSWSTHGQLLNTLFGSTSQTRNIVIFSKLGKRKTCKAVAKRFRRTGSGKLKYWPAGKTHNMLAKSNKARRQLRKARYVSKTQLKMLNKMISGW